jgi:hypothetical protein
MLKAQMDRRLRIKEEKRIQNILDAGGKVCNKCNILKEGTDYYNNRTQCKECVLEEQRHKAQEQRDIKQQELIELGVPTSRVLQTPGTYTDELQRTATRTLLESMGWSFNEELNIFYKYPIKDETGRWLNLKDAPKTSSQVKKIRSKIRSKMTIDTLPKISVTKFRRANTPSDEVINQVTYDYFINKLTLIDLEMKYGVGYNTLHQYILKVYEIMEDAI